MKKYRLSIVEEIGGYIEVNAQDATHAETLVEDLLDEYGADRLFYPIPEDKQVLSKYHTRHTHGDRGVFSCKEINDN
jgi:hypothetical protein